MTTLLQLDKFANQGFNAQMRRRGFAVERMFYFWRKRGPLFDVLWSEILSGGDLLRIYVTILSPWVDDPQHGQFAKFPECTSLIGGNLSSNFPETMHSGELFDVAESDMGVCLEEILTLVDQKVIPWFDSVNSAEAYGEYVGRRGFHPAPEQRERIKRGIEIGFEREPYR